MITTPYNLKDGIWLKGNLHTHTSPTSACADIAIIDSVNRYVELGYDFISLSDHLTFTDLDDNRIILIPGFEWNSTAGEHTGIYSAEKSVIQSALTYDNQDELLKEMSNAGALVILNHPNWLLEPHYRREQLLPKSDFHGIEIYNGVIERLQGYAISTDKWDYLLAKGKRVFGYASDDSHLITDIGRACNMVYSASRKPEDILTALKTGSFYASSGVIIDEISVSGSVIRIRSNNAQEIKAITDGGCVFACVRSGFIELDIADYLNRRILSDYIRFELYGPGSSMAWTQVFYLG